MKKNIIILVVFVGAVLVAGGFYVDRHMMMNPDLNLLKQTSQPVATNAAENVELKDYGPAPDFVGIQQWLDGDPQTVASLKGKVVLVDFWTFSCINCIRTLPYVTKWYDTYKDQGLVVIGIHTPEFDFEKDASNVSDAIGRFKIHYPVALDNKYATWNNYNNQYWPAEYLIDKQGHVRYVHFGEGEYDHTENAIRELLGMTASVRPDNGVDLAGVKSPEMYFGTERLEYLSQDQKPGAATYTFPTNLALNTFALEGKWQFHAQDIQLQSGTGKIKLKFHSGKIFMVAASQVAAVLKITVDGKPQPSVTVQESKLYALFDSKDYTDHVIEIEVDQAGFQAFTFTFG